MLLLKLYTPLASCSAYISYTDSHYTHTQSGEQASVQAATPIACRPAATTRQLALRREVLLFSPPHPHVTQVVACICGPLPSFFVCSIFFCLFKLGEAAGASPGQFAFSSPLPMLVCARLYVCVCLCLSSLSFRLSLSLSPPPPPLSLPLSLCTMPYLHLTSLAHRSGPLASIPPPPPPLLSLHNAAP